MPETEEDESGVELITVCVPHHTGWRHLRSLLSSLRKMDVCNPNFHVLIADNASRDGSREMLREHFPEAQILCLEKNLGFAPALNRAAENATTEWLAFLNNDMRVHPRWLFEAMQAVETHQVPCVASRILNWDGSKTQFAGGEVNLLGKGFEWGDEDCNVEEERRLLFACGGGMLIQRDLFLECGGFDEEYEMIYEDVDLGWRLNLYGHKVRYAPRSMVYHRQHASLAEVPYSRKAIFFERNSLATLYKNLGAEMWATLFPALMRLAVHRTQAMRPSGPDGYDHLRGIQAFFDALPRWREKRKQVQSCRTVSDEEILPRFFPNPTRLWAYTCEHKDALKQSSYVQFRDTVLERILDGREQIQHNTSSLVTRHS